MKARTVALLFLVLMFAGCSNWQKNSKGVYVLLDTSAAYTPELQEARSIVTYLLLTLKPGDTLAVADIDTKIFSRQNVIAEATFDQRPSVANDQKRALNIKIETSLATAAGGSYTNISGGLLEAAKFLEGIGADQKYVLILSTLKEEVAKGYMPDVPLDLAGLEIAALNVSALQRDDSVSENYLTRVEYWQKKIESGKGNWHHVQEFNQLKQLFMD